MRESIREFVALVADAVAASEPVYEFGALQVEGQEGFADLRRYFPGKHYIGCDMRDGPGVDEILDLHDIGLDSGSVGTVLLLDTLEHVERPRRAMEEVHRILRDGGLVIMSSVMNFPIHNYPHDYWRFTPEAFKSLLSPFHTALVDFAGAPSFPHTVVGIGSKGAGGSLDDLRTKLGAWKQRWEDPLGRRWIKYVKPWVPPVSFHLYARALRLRGPRKQRSE